jgi:hypothetical protein
MKGSLIGNHEQGTQPLNTIHVLSALALPPYWNEELSVWLDAISVPGDWLYHNVFIPSSTNGHLGFFQFLIITDGADIDILVSFFG